MHDYDEECTCIASRRKRLKMGTPKLVRAHTERLTSEFSNIIFNGPTEADSCLPQAPRGATAPC